MMNANLVVERDRLMQAEITLDGYPAKLAGRLERFAHVWAWTGDVGDLQYMKDVELAWSTVQHIIDNHNGEFRS